MSLLKCPYGIVSTNYPKRERKHMENPPSLQNKERKQP